MFYKPSNTVPDFLIFSHLLFALGFCLIILEVMAIIMIKIQGFIVQSKMMFFQCSSNMNQSDKFNSQSLQFNFESLENW